MNKAIMIGAGQIGRGFIGMELEQAGYHVLFADINMDVINDMQRRGEYTVHMVDTECVDTTVRNISAVSSLDPALPRAFGDADVTLVCTSVGQTALVKVAPAIAQGIAVRAAAGITAPMNIIAVENAIGGTSQLKAHIYEQLDDSARQYAEEHIGFPNCAVDRIIPPNKRGTNAGDVVVEKYYEWDVEKSGIKAEILPIDGLHLVDDLSAYLERKLFTLNGPNAVTACYGWLKGYATINEALEDREIYDLIWGMMTECGAMLQRRHGFTAEEMLAYRTKLMQRFMNPHIIDSVTRVAREPIRKLSPNDRIIAPLRYAEEYKLDTSCYRTGVAAVLLYNNPDDAQSQQLTALIKDKGVRAAMESVSGIAADSALAAEIEKEYLRLQKQYVIC